MSGERSLREDLEQPLVPIGAADVVHVPAGTSLSAILFKLVTEAVEALDYNPDVARTLLKGAADLLKSDHAQRTGLTARTPAQAALAPWQAKRVARHIDENLERSLLLRELASIAGLSDSYFSCAFKGSFGQTPHAFIVCKRVERARQQMLESQEPLSQIAPACGFADQAHLTRIFRRETGLTPSSWRLANRTAIDRLHCDAPAHHHGHVVGLSPRPPRAPPGDAHE